MSAATGHCWDDVVSGETRRIYASYARESSVGPRPALVLIDLYNLVYEGGPRPVAELVDEYPSSCGAHAWEALPPTQRLLVGARAARLPIVHVTYDGRPETDARGTQPTRRHRRKPGPDSYRFKAELAPLPGELVVYKKRASAFFGTPLQAQLHLLGAQSLILAGESTSGCLRASAIDAFSFGWHSVVVEECCFDRHLLSHKVNLFDIHHKYADVMHIDATLAALERLA